MKCLPVAATKTFVKLGGPARCAAGADTIAIVRAKCLMNPDFTKNHFELFNLPLAFAVDGAALDRLDGVARPDGAHVNDQLPERREIGLGPLEHLR